MDSNVEVLKGPRRIPPDIIGSLDRPASPTETNSDLLAAKRGRRVNGVSQVCDRQQSSDMVEEKGFHSA